MTAHQVQGTTPGTATGHEASHVTGLWPTHVWLGHLDLTATTWCDGAGGSDPHNAESLPFVREVQDAAVAACCPGTPTGWVWSCVIEQWGPGYFVGARHSASELRLIVILRSDSPAQHPDSGALSVHDPRDGAGNVALPGLPWGRPLKLPAHRGLALAVPGWLRWSVSPLRPPHTMTVWTSYASRTPNPEGRDMHTRDAEHEHAHQPGSSPAVDRRDTS
jgi:hypothetical protein